MLSNTLNFRTEPPATGGAGGCVDLKVRARSPIVTITEWRCTRDGEWLRRERHHDWPALAVVRTGASRVHRRAGAVLAEPTSLVLHEPFSPYRTSHPFGCGDGGVTITIRPDVLREIQPRAARDESAFFPVQVMTCPPRARLRLLRLLDAAAPGQAVPLLEAEDAALALAHEALSTREANRPDGGTPVRGCTLRDHGELVDRCRAFLLEHVERRLSLSDIAKAVGSSAFHMARVFRRTTGLTLGRYQNRLRLAMALEALSERESGLSELAARLGFSSHSHFSVAFRREFGVVPSRALPARARPGPAPTGRPPASGPRP